MKRLTPNDAPKFNAKDHIYTESPRGGTVIAVRATRKLVEEIAHEHGKRAPYSVYLDMMAGRVIETQNNRYWM